MIILAALVFLMFVVYRGYSVINDFMTAMQARPVLVDRATLI